MVVVNIACSDWIFNTMDIKEIKPSNKVPAKPFSEIENDYFIELVMPYKAALEDKHKDCNTTEEKQGMEGYTK